MHYSGVTSVILIITVILITLVWCHIQTVGLGTTAVELGAAVQSRTVEEQGQREQQYVGRAIRGLSRQNSLAGQLFMTDRENLSCTLETDQLPCSLVNNRDCSGVPGGWGVSKVVG